MTPRPTDREIAITKALLPHVDVSDAVVTRTGGSHDVVLLPGVAAVRIARTADATHSLPRRTALLTALADAHLPFAVPAPLGPVQTVHGSTAVAVSWIGGAAAPSGSGDPAALRAVLDALTAVDLAPLSPLLDRPHAYAGRDDWHALMLTEALPRLPRRLHGSGHRRIDAALALEPVTARLVHGDLGGDNMHWSADGRLLGVLDWDLAQPFDPAIDAACLAHWHGWETIRRAVGTATLRRARVWHGTFAMEQIVRQSLDGADDAAMADCVQRVVRWMDADDRILVR